ncbi:unnamed protein product [Auanema sp. JU1783]|nr:unnamed protein product [Auanema sp. JU1783]
MDQNTVPSLKFLTTRDIALKLFITNIRWRKIKDVAYELGDVLKTMRVPNQLREMIREAIGEVLREVRRWDDKHKEMFCESKKSGRVMNKAEHLRFFYRHLLWKHSSFLIEDLETAKHLMETQCSDWPQMQFQFACLYALTDWIEDARRFDKYRCITFRKQLGEHPVYDFWLTLMTSDWDIFFDTETRLANQKLQLGLKFAITHGYYELMRYIWDKIGNATKEYIGLLQWRAMCFRAQDRETMRFLCERLCEMNPIGVARISWTAFWSTFYDMINNEKSDVVVQKQFKRRFEFLIENCCPELRRRLLGMENFRVVADSFRYNQADTFALLLDHMDAEQLRNAREIVDRIHGRRQSIEGTNLRKAMIRRQMTTTD